MPRISTATVSKYQRDRIHASHVMRGEKFTLSTNLAGAVDPNATITAVTWRVNNPQSLILASATRAAKSTTLTTTAGYGTGATIKCQCSLSDGSIVEQLFRVRVTDYPYFMGETLPVTGPFSVTA